MMHIQAGLPFGSPFSIMLQKLLSAEYVEAATYVFSKKCSRIYCFEKTYGRASTISFMDKKTVIIF